MRAARLLAAAVCVTAASTALGAIKPRPTIDRMCADVPLIVEGRHEGEGVLRITQTFKSPDGFEPAGGTLDVHRLEKHALRTGAVWAGERENLETDHVVLFLVRDDEGRWESLHTLDGNGDPGSIGSSGAFWIDGDGRCHGYVQCMNPGPYDLLPAGVTAGAWLPETVEALRDDIASGLRRARDWDRTLALEPGPERVRRLMAYLSPATSPDAGRDTRIRDVPEALAACGEHAVEPLRTFLAAAEYDGGKVAALRTATRLGEVAAPLVDVIAPYLRSENVTITGASIDALGATGSERAVPHLRTCLADERFWVYREAAGELARLGDVASFDAIAAKLPDDLAPERAGGIADVLLQLDRLDPERAAPLLDRYIALPAMASTVRYLRSIRAGKYRRAR